MARCGALRRALRRALITVCPPIQGFGGVSFLQFRLIASLKDHSQNRPLKCCFEELPSHGKQTCDSTLQMDSSEIKR